MVMFDNFFEVNEAILAVEQKDNVKFVRQRTTKTFGCDGV